jgi:toxin FitB
MILDTNVLAESTRREPLTSVARWIAAQPADQLFVTTVSLAEMLLGIALLPQEHRRTGLEEAITRIFRTVFTNRLLGFDEAAARVYSQYMVDRRRMGLPVSTSDAQIVAIARSQGAHAIVTRNVRDFEGCGISIINPWDSR